MKTKFKKLNSDWNAEPNCPEPRVGELESYLSLKFFLNHWLFEKFSENDLGEIRFYGANRWRLGATNDEGWSKGQCRFSKLAPKWGEFYEVEGDSLIELSPDDWKTTEYGLGSKHYIFYMRDDTFECSAESFTFQKCKNT